MKTYALLAGLLLLSLPAAADHHEAGEWTDLFDGTSLKGWVDDGGKPATNEKWVAKDGVLHLTGKGGGNLYTAKEYGDFEFSAEWKISPKGNSGIKYRMAKYGKGGLLGPEYQVYDDGPNPHGKGATGGLYDLIAPDPKTKKLNPVGAWNTTRIVVKGKRFQHFLNGKKVVDITIGSPEWKEALAASKFSKQPGFAENASGPIMLQDHGNPVWFRKLRIREL